MSAAAAATKSFFYPEPAPSDCRRDESPKPEGYVLFGRSFLDARDIGVIGSVIVLLSSLYLGKEGRGNMAKTLLTGSLTSLGYALFASRDGYSSMRCFSEGLSGSLTYQVGRMVEKYIPQFFSREGLNLATQTSLVSMATKIATDILHFRKPQLTDVAAAGAGALVGRMFDNTRMRSLDPEDIRSDTARRCSLWASDVYLSVLLTTAIASLTEQLITVSLRYNYTPGFSDNSESVSKEVLVGVLVQPLIALIVAGAETHWILDANRQMNSAYTTSENTYPYNHPEWSSQRDIRASAYEARATEVFKAVNQSQRFVLPTPRLE